MFLHQLLIHLLLYLWGQPFAYVVGLAYTSLLCTVHHFSHKVRVMQHILYILIGSLRSQMRIISSRALAYLRVIWCRLVAGCYRLGLIRMFTVPLLCFSVHLQAYPLTHLAGQHCGSIHWHSLFSVSMIYSRCIRYRYNIGFLFRRILHTILGCAFHCTLHITTLIPRCCLRCQRLVLIAGSIFATRCSTLRGTRSYALPSFLFFLLFFCQATRKCVIQCYSSVLINVQCQIGLVCLILCHVVVRL